MTRTPPGRQIIVGVDGSAASAGAVRWAVAACAGRSAPSSWSLPATRRAGTASADRTGPWPRPEGDVRPYLAGRPYRLGRHVPDLRDFLSRFRPAGAPGAALAGVPADRQRELEAEVGPVLALLAGTQAECERIITQARLRQHSPRPRKGL